MIAITKDKPIYYAVGNPVIVAGCIEVGGLVVTGLPTVTGETEKEFLDAVQGKGSGYQPLPESGQVDAGQIYSYDGSLVICRQSHSRMIYTPAKTPALFSVYREDASDVLDWIACEKVEKGHQRVYKDITYTCIQAHQTQSDWTPDKTHTLWKEVVETPDEPPEWKQPGSTNYYVIDDMVTHKGHLWKSLCAVNVWGPGVFGWADLGVYP